MPRVTSPLTPYRRLAFKVNRGNLAPEAINARLPHTPLKADRLRQLLADAETLALTDPHAGLALARVAYAEAQRSSWRLSRAMATYTLAACLNRADEWREALAKATEARTIFTRLGKKVEAARCDWQAAYAHRYLAKYSEGVAFARLAEKAFRREHDALWLGRALLERARNLTPLSRFSDTRKVLLKARAIFERLRRDHELALCDLAEAARLADSGDHASALQVIQSACQNLAQLGCRPDVGWAEYQQGRIASYLCQFDVAINSLERATDIFRQLRLRFRLGLTYNQWGVTLMHRGEFTEATPLLEQALNYLEATHPDGFYSAFARANLGLTAIMAGRLAEASRLVRATRDAFAKLGIPSRIAWSEACLGFLAREQGQFDLAILYMESALRTWRELKEEHWVAEVVEDIGMLYSLLNERETGRAYLEESQNYYRKAKRLVDTARVQIQLARLSIAENRPEEALSPLREAAEIAETAGTDWLRAQAEAALSEAYAALDHEEAEGHFAFADSLFARLYALPERAASALRRAEMWLQAGQAERSHQIAEEAFADWREPPPELLWQLHFLHARLVGDERKSLEKFRASIATLQAARRTLSREELVGAFLATRRLVFDDAVRLALDLGEAQAAFEFAEEYRTQTLTGHLRRPSAPGNERPSPARRERDRLRAAIWLMREQFIGRPGLPIADPDRSIVSDDQPVRLEQLLREYAAASASVLRESVAGVSDLASWPEWGWPEFRQRLEAILPQGWCGLAYHRLGDQWVIFEFSAAGVTARRVKPSPADQAALAAATQLDADEHARFLRRDGEGFRRRLYRLLIPPTTARELKAGKLLLILPHGQLNSLPFHALQASDRKYLIEKAVVGYAPSLLTLALLAERPAASDAKRALILARTGEAESLNALPAARREIEAIQSTFGVSARLLLDDEATAEALKRLSEVGELAKFGVLHFIAHGMFEGRASRLALAEGGLLVDDLADLRLQARIVTLSTCNGGLRAVYPGEEWVGLTQAFLAAGAGCVVAGLWGMPDAFMPGLMREFYSNLLNGQTAAFALAAAQRSGLKLRSEPYFWAPLAAVGLP